MTNETTFSADEITVLNSIAFAHVWLTWDGVIRTTQSEMGFIARCQYNNPEYNWLEMLNENRSRVARNACHYLLPEKAESLQDEKKEEAQPMTNKPTPREMVQDAVNYIHDTDAELDMAPQDVTPIDIQQILRDAFGIKMSTGEISDLLYEIEHTPDTENGPSLQTLFPW